MGITSYCARSDAALCFARLNKKFKQFSQSLANDDVKTFLNILKFDKHYLFVSRKETEKKTSGFVVELSKIEEKDKIIENLYAMFKSK